MTMVRGVFPSESGGGPAGSPNPDYEDGGDQGKKDGEGEAVEAPFVQTNGRRAGDRTGSKRDETDAEEGGDRLGGELHPISFPLKSYTSAAAISTG